MPLERRPLGRSGLTVPSLCLGTMMYGDQIDESDAQRQMDRCFERGIDFFDTAEIYTIPPKPETQGESERIVGRWVEARGLRDRVTLATKLTGRSDNAWLRGGDPVRVTRAQMREALDRSLRNLRTDYVDLYQIHWPDRPVNSFGASLTGYRPYEEDGASIEEQLGWLGELVTEGKVRTVGLSNETAWGVMAFLRAADQGQGPRVVSVQNAFNLLNRTYEEGLAEIAQREEVGLLAYSPIAQGVLTGKYLGGAKPEGSRGERFARLSRYQTPSAVPATERYVAVARDLGVHPAVLAMQFVTTRPFTTSNIFGARSDVQLDLIFESLDWPFGEAALSAVNAVHARLPNPCP